MKMNKFAAALVGTAVAASAVSVTAFADDSYTATLGFTDTNWTYQDWESSVEITGDGTYTITSTAVAGTEEIGVFVIDCQGMFAAAPDAVATLDSIQIDGADVSFDASKIMYGDIEEKGNFRIDIYNMYSDTKDDPAFTNATSIAESLSITFTVTGLGGAAAEDTAEETAEESAEEEAPAEEAAEEAAEEEAPASDDVTAPAATGNASAAAIAAVAAVAGAAAVISRKRK
ncbi:MAG: hypothetical protein ACI4K7_07810 [Oscillospiraceae bacterium]